MRETKFNRSEQLIDAIVKFGGDATTFRFLRDENLVGDRAKFLFQPPALRGFCGQSSHELFPLLV
jgi:hypothetical protein